MYAASTTAHRPAVLSIPPVIIATGPGACAADRRKKRRLFPSFTRPRQDSTLLGHDGPSAGPARRPQPGTSQFLRRNERNLLIPILIRSKAGYAVIQSATSYPELPRNHPVRRLAARALLHRLATGLSPSTSTRQATPHPRLCRAEVVRDRELIRSRARSSGSTQTSPH